MRPKGSFRGPVRVVPFPESDFVNYVERISSEAKDSGNGVVSHPVHKAFVIAQLFKVGQEVVSVFGMDLPEDIFYSDRVCSAMEEFLARNSEYRIEYVVNDSTRTREMLSPRFKDMIASGRIVLHEIADIPVDLPFWFVLAKSPNGYSFWEQTEPRESGTTGFSQYRFHSPDRADNFKNLLETVKKWAEAKNSQ